jgi:hypothetical protein
MTSRFNIIVLSAFLSFQRCSLKFAKLLIVVTVVLHLHLHKA